MPCGPHVRLVSPWRGQTLRRSASVRFTFCRNSNDLCEVCFMAFLSLLALHCRFHKPKFKIHLCSFCSLHHSFSLKINLTVSHRPYHKGPTLAPHVVKAWRPNAAPPDKNSRLDMFIESLRARLEHHRAQCPTRCTGPRIPDSLTGQTEASSGL